MSIVQSYRDLRIWQAGMDFVVDLYKVTDSFPKSEMYGLTNQLRRAAVSVPSNIAEGHSRSRAEFARFLSIALGSIAELETQLELANRIGYLSDENFKKLTTQINSIGRQTNSLRNKIKNDKK